MMDKLISQQAAIDTLKELTANGTNKGMVFGEDAVHRIEMLPSAQPDIIRCKDCKHYNKHREDYMCGLNVLAYVRENDFCSRAERSKDA